jgi:hypothetical protein
MRLVTSLIMFNWLSGLELKDAILERRNAIRGHRDARGDDRCWLDDYLVWELVDGMPDLADCHMTREAGMRSCRDFYEFRRADLPDPVPRDAIRDPKLWDEDLKILSRPRLLDELLRLHRAIEAHALEARLTVAEDRALYAILPEKLAADFRLPARQKFLVPVTPESGCPAPRYGCPQFWDSHAACGAKCNLHQWGPC